MLAGVALSLGLDAGYFAAGYTADPTILFRIFHYPPSLPQAGGWGVGEHTDYGLLTLLAQDDAGGLQVRAPDGWIDAPPIPGTLVCNIGDMLDRLTGGRYRSTPHRVRNLSGHDRLSFPFFLDPGFADEVPPLPALAAAGDDGRRAVGRPGPASLRRHLRRLPPRRRFPRSSRSSAATCWDNRHAQEDAHSGLGRALGSTGAGEGQPHSFWMKNTSMRR